MEEYNDYINYISHKTGVTLPSDITKNRDNIGVYYKIGNYCFTNPNHALRYSAIFQNLKEMYNG